MVSTSRQAFYAATCGSATPRPLREIPRIDAGIFRDEYDQGEGYDLAKQSMSAQREASSIEVARPRGVAVPAMALLMALERRAEARLLGDKFTVSVVGEVRK